MTQPSNPHPTDSEIAHVLRDLSQSGNPNELHDFAEALADICDTVFVAQHTGETAIPDSRNVVSMTIDWACEFHARYRGCDWSEGDYIETIQAFAEAKLAPLRLNAPDAEADAPTPLPDGREQGRAAGKPRR